MQDYSGLKEVASDLHKMNVQFDKKISQHQYTAFMIGFGGAWILVELLIPLPGLWSILPLPIGFSWVLIVMFFGHKIFNQELARMIAIKTEEYQEEVRKILIAKGADSDTIEFERQKEYDHVWVNATINDVRKRIKIIHHMNSHGKIDTPDTAKH